MTATERAIREAVEKGGWKDWLIIDDDKSCSIYFGAEAKKRIDGAFRIEGARWGSSYDAVEQAFLDPAFWQALGKARGWGYNIAWSFTVDKKDVAIDDKLSNDLGLKPDWLWHWHRFIDHIAGGKDAETFFAEIYKV